MSRVTIGLVSGDSSNDLMIFWLSTYAHIKSIGIDHDSLFKVAFCQKKKIFRECRNFRISIHEHYIAICNVSLKGPAIGQSSADQRSTIGAVGQLANKKISGGHSVNCGPLIARLLAKILLKVELLSADDRPA